MAHQEEPAMVVDDRVLREHPSDFTFPLIPGRGSPEVLRPEEPALKGSRTGGSTSSAEKPRVPTSTAKRQGQRKMSGSLARMASMPIFPSCHMLTGVVVSSASRSRSDRTLFLLGTVRRKPTPVHPRPERQESVRGPPRRWKPKPSHASPAPEAGTPTCCLPARCRGPGDELIGADIGPVGAWAPVPGAGPERDRLRAEGAWRMDPLPPT